VADDPDAWRLSGRQFIWRGQSIFYRDQGAGEPLLLLHGFPTSSWDWHRVWPALAARRRLIAPDLLGFGFSAKPRVHEYSILEQATIVESLLDHLQVHHIDILAHNMGDTVAQELLARVADRIATGDHDQALTIGRACFLNGGLFPEAHRPRLIQRLLLTRLGPLLGGFLDRAKLEKTFARIFGPATQPSHDEIDALWSILSRDGGHRLLHKLIRYMPERVAHRERWVGILQDARVPLRLIVGDADPVSGKTLSARYRELIKNHDIVVLDHIGHYPQIEAPDAVVRESLVFFQKSSDQA
jgi:pimeloyl-ACP methyl ester carboxylesterase